uniref:Secreted protein n=1 Tax=Rhipicephalus appendiculatus TaxID=34631 RepID=A0A131YDB5_RHIAP
MVNSIGRFGALAVAVFLLHAEQVCYIGRLRALPVCFIGRSRTAPLPDPLHGAAVSTSQKSGRFDRKFHVPRACAKHGIPRD